MSASWPGGIKDTQVFFDHYNSLLASLAAAIRFIEKDQVQSRIETYDRDSRLPKAQKKMTSLFLASPIARDLLGLGEASHISPADVLSLLWSA